MSAPPGNARRGTAPCGHAGYYVVGNYIACPFCDPAGEPDPAAALPCPKCGSRQTEPFATETVVGTHCWPCGHFWTAT